jgi:uncharacterized lipoprotein
MMVKFRISTVLLVVVVTALSGCSIFGKKSSYDTARETRPLEVPPDLDSPSTAGAMVVPDQGSVGGASPDSAPQAIYAGAESSLRVSDAATGVWRRVGLALERSGVGKLDGRDESAGTYTLSGTSQASTKPGGNFVSRMFKRDKAESVAVTRVVRVKADGEGSLIQVEDESGSPVDDEFARRLIAAIKQRLG